ncbi:hypothetical protein FB446DRAFT_775735, partial [Lentinula raphanica]
MALSSSPRTSSTPQRRQTSSRGISWQAAPLMISSPTSPHPQAPSPTQPTTVIQGAYFAGAKEFTFKEHNEFNSVEGDMVVEEDSESELSKTTWTTGSNFKGASARNPQRDSYCDRRASYSDYPDYSSYSYPYSSSSSSAPQTSNPISNPQWAPGTNISGQFFPGSAGLTFSGDNEFNSVKGTMIRKTRRSTHPGPGGNPPRTAVVDLAHHRNPTPSFPPPNVTRAAPTHGVHVHISGEFFAGAYGGHFAGKNEFNADAYNHTPSPSKPFSAQKKSRSPSEREACFPGPRMTIDAVLLAGLARKPIYTETYLFKTLGLAWLPMISSDSFHLPSLGQLGPKNCCWALVAHKIGAFAMRELLHTPVPVCLKLVLKSRAHTMTLRNSSIPQRKQTPGVKSASSPAPPTQSTVIQGTYFAGATEFTFKQRNEFNSVEGDMVVEEDESEKTTVRAASPQWDSYPSSSSSAPRRASSPISNPQWAPGTTISGHYFAGSSSMKFSGDNEFNSVKGTMVKTRRSKNTAGTYAGGPGNPRIVDLSHKKQSNSSSSSTSSPPNTVPNLHGVNISGDFFAGAHDARFTGMNEFNAVGQNLYKTIHVDGSERLSTRYIEVRSQIGLVIDDLYMKILVYPPYLLYIMVSRFIDDTASMTGAEMEMDTVEVGVSTLDNDGNGVPWLVLGSKGGGAVERPPEVVLLLLRLRYWAIFSSMEGDTSTEILLRSSADFDHPRRDIERRSPRICVERIGLVGLDGWLELKPMDERS